MAKKMIPSDSDLIDALERDVLDNGPILIWDGVGKFLETSRGLAILRDGGIRAALSVLVREIPAEK
jgi:hypothetical protein